MLHSGVGLGVEKGERGISPQGEGGISWGETSHFIYVLFECKPLVGAA